MLLSSIDLYDFCCFLCVTVAVGMCVNYSFFNICISCFVTTEVVSLHCLGYFCAICGTGCVDSCDTCLLGWPVKILFQQCPAVFIGDWETTANNLSKQKLYRKIVIVREHS